MTKHRRTFARKLTLPKTIPNQVLHRSESFHGIDFVATFLLVAFCIAPLPVDGKIVSLHFLCPFLTFTSLPCPFCGLTRSLIYGAHFQFHQALQYHVLGPMLLVVLLTSSTRLLVFVTCRRFPLLEPFCNTFSKRISRPKLPARFTFVAVFTLTTLLWIARLAGFLPLPHSVF